MSSLLANVPNFKRYSYIGEFCYRLWLIYDRKQLERNHVNEECGLFSEEVNTDMCMHCLPDMIFCLR